MAAATRISRPRRNRETARVAYVCDVEANPGEVCRRARRNSATHRRPKATSGKFSSAKMSTLSPSPPRPLARAYGHRGRGSRQHVYVEKPCSHNPAEGALLIEAQKKYGSWCRWARSSAPRRTPSKSSRRSRWGDRPGLLRDGWYVTRASPSLWQGRARAADLDWICGRARAAQTLQGQRPAYNWHWFAYGAPAKPSTTARTKSTSAAGRWASTIPIAWPPPAAATTTKTTGSSTHPGDELRVRRHAHLLDCRCCNGMKIDNRDRGSTSWAQRLGAGRSRRLRGIRPGRPQDR